MTSTDLQQNLNEELKIISCRENVKLSTLPLEFSPSNYNELRSVFFERRQESKFVWVRNESGESPSKR